MATDTQVSPIRVRDEDVRVGDTMVVLGHNRPVLRIDPYTGPLVKLGCFAVAVFPALTGSGESGVTLWKGQHSEVHRVEPLAQEAA
jgi:metallophosphoesterase superfamily enzyme